MAQHVLGSKHSSLRVIFKFSEDGERGLCSPVVWFGEFVVFVITISLLFFKVQFNSG